MLRRCAAAVSFVFTISRTNSRACNAAASQSTNVAAASSARPATRKPSHCSAVVRTAHGMTPQLACLSCAARASHVQGHAAASPVGMSILLRTRCARAACFVPLTMLSRCNQSSRRLQGHTEFLGLQRCVGTVRRRILRSCVFGVAGERISGTILMMATTKEVASIAWTSIALLRRI